MKAVRIAIGILICSLLALGMGGCSRARILDERPDAAFAFDRSIVRMQGGSEAGEQSPVEGSRITDDSDNAKDDVAAPAVAESDRAWQEADSSSSSATSPNVTSDTADDWQTVEQKTPKPADPLPDSRPSQPDAPVRQTQDDNAPVDENTTPTPDADTENRKRDTENVPEEPAPEADPIGTQIEAYKRYIGARHQTVFPCQQTNVYAELVTDYEAAARPGPLNKAILTVEAVNLGEDKITPVSDAWVRGMNPGLIVKVVDASILGPGISTTAQAEGMQAAIAERPDWTQIDAVKSNDIVLVSESLLETDAGLMILELYLGMYIYPDAYGDLIEAGGSDFVYQDILGTSPDGIYFYPSIPQG